MTPFSEIYKLFLSDIEDYQLSNDFIQYPEMTNERMKNWLKQCIPEFDCCTKNLEDADFELEVFNFDLEISEINILASLMTVKWWTYITQDILNIRAILQDEDFHVTGHYQTLRSMELSLANARERADYLIRKYTFVKYPISKWGE